MQVVAAKQECNPICTQPSTHRPLFHPTAILDFFDMQLVTLIGFFLPVQFGAVVALVWATHLRTRGRLKLLLHFFDSVEQYSALFLG